MPEKRRRGNGKKLSVRGAREHNLQAVDVDFPLGTFIAVTGVSGSGKSTLVDEVLYRALARDLSGSRAAGRRARPGARASSTSTRSSRSTRAPSGGRPRSNPATYVGLFDADPGAVRRHAEARVRGYQPGRFSFNVKGGRCENCKGDGHHQDRDAVPAGRLRPCEICKGKRYGRETLEIHYKGRTIADVLEMTVEEAIEFFSAVPTVTTKLQTLCDVGLGYVHLGQPATTLSGGEAQRVKLATELSKRATGRRSTCSTSPRPACTSPTSTSCSHVLHRLVDTGNTVLVIEHNLDVIKTADWIVDLGPEGGHRGGRVIAEGTPEKVAATDELGDGRVPGTGPAR